MMNQCLWTIRREAAFFSSFRDMKVVLKFHFVCVLVGFSQKFWAIFIDLKMLKLATGQLIATD